MLRSQINWRTRCVTGNEDDYYPHCRTSPSQWQTSQTIDPDEFKTTSITSNGYNWQPDTWEVATAPLNASIHGRNLESSESNWHRRRVTDIEDEDHEYKHSYKSIERDHQSKHLQWTEWPYHKNAALSTIKAKSESIDQSAQSRLHFFQLSEVHLSQVVYTPTALATSKEPTCRSMFRIPTEEDLCMNEVLLLPWTSTRAKCTYGEDTSRCKHIQHDKLSFDWSELTAAIHCAVWSAWTISHR